MRRAAASTALAIALGVAAACAGCTQKKGEDRDHSEGSPPPDDPAPPPPALTRHTVLVVDQGFDPRQPWYKDVVIASQAVTCDASEPFPATASAEERKKFALDAYASRFTKCTWTDGIDFELPTAIKDLEGDRTAWNDAVRAKSADLAATKSQQIRAAVAGAAGREWHGTAVAGLVAWQNPGVRLVLLQVPAVDPGPCPTQAALDAWVETHADPDVRRAYREAALDEDDARRIALLKKHDVTVVVDGMSPASRAASEAQRETQGCGKLDYAAYFKTKNELRRSREDFRRGRGDYDRALPLTFLGAGDEGLTVDAPDDAGACGDAAMNRATVGALTFGDARAAFSNAGKCVDFTALGDDVVTPAPDAFLTVASGTSLAAALVARYATKTFDPAKSAADHLAKLRETAADDLVPDEIAYADAKDPLTAAP